MRGPLVSTFIAAAFVLPGCTGLAGNGSDSMGPIGATTGGAGSVPPPAMNAAGNAGTTSPTPGAGAGAGGVGSTPASTAPVATPTIARLSTLQWANTVRALLQLPDPGDLDNSLTKDAVVRFDNEADSLFVSQDLHDDLQSEAERLAALVTATPANVAKLVPAGAPSDTAGKAKAYIQDFGRRAYRRPLTADEVQAYTTLFNQGPTLTSGMGAFEAGMRVTLEAFLQAPDFVYRTSIGGAAVAGKAHLNDYEIAANLSYALTNSPPDATLSAAADQSALSAAGAIEAQAKRLIATDGGKSAVDRFFFQYFGLGQYDTLQKDPAIAPQFTAATGPQLHAEAQQLLQYLFAQNLGLKEIFTSTVGFVNAPVAKLYGLSGTFDANSWTQVTLEQRPGVLSRLGFLSYYAHQTLQDSIHRGANINSRILCTELSPPPGIAIPPLPAQDPSQTNRELVTAFTEGCGRACHTPYINPAGFAFESFDGVGAYRSTENGKPIDTSGSYTFEAGPKSFANLAEFTQLLASSPQAHACYTKKWAADLYARKPRQNDEAVIATLAQRSVDQHLSSQDVVLSLVTNDAFSTRIEGAQ
jgi:Protein of unknown function (DUF1592)/Protein of unknown function (DUF1588)/Protein of unknown function (DUF1595)/Protein of unknown function (DUF1585)/Protein of unknown function (DUF1587)